MIPLLDDEGGGMQVKQIGKWRVRRGADELRAFDFQWMAIAFATRLPPGTYNMVAPTYDIVISESDQPAPPPAEPPAPPAPADPPAPAEPPVEPPAPSPAPPTYTDAFIAETVVDIFRASIRWVPMGRDLDAWVQLARDGFYNGSLRYAEAHQALRAFIIEDSRKYSGLAHVPPGGYDADTYRPPVFGEAPAPAPAPAPNPAPGSGLILTPASMRADMVGDHEAHMIGVPREWSWGSRADPGFGLRGMPWANADYTMWGIVGAAVGGQVARNARVQMRNLRTDFKVGSWRNAQTTNDFGGSVYTDYSRNASHAANTRAGDGGGQAVLIPDSGGHYHFYPRARVPNYPRDSIEALVVSMDVRLVLDDPNGPDELDRARILAVSAGDAYAPGGSWPNNGHAPIGRFRFVRREWTTVTAHLGLSSDAQFAEYIAWRG